MPHYFVFSSFSCTSSYETLAFPLPHQVITTAAGKYLASSNLLEATRKLFSTTYISIFVML